MSSIKLWQRTLRADLTSQLTELDNLDGLDFSKPVLVCLPGVSTTHDIPRSINGYMGVAEKILGGRQVNARINTISVSYENAEEQLESIQRSNDDPRNFYSEEAKQFAERVMAPLLAKGVDVNLYAKSYGPVFMRMAINALNDMGIRPEPHQVRMVATGNVSRLNFDRKDQTTAIFIEGTNDERAAKLNRYKTATPKNHQQLPEDRQLTITPLSDKALHVLTFVPESVKVERYSPTKGAWIENITDAERHTTRLYSTPGGLNHDQVMLLQRVTRNMITQEGKAFTTESCLTPCQPLAPMDATSEAIYNASSKVVTEHIDAALERGIRNTQTQAVFFDWDLTLANGESASLNALNATFDKMAEIGYKVPKTRDWKMDDMRRHFFPTVPKFFENTYGEYGKDVVESAIATFREERAVRRSDVKLVAGAKEILRGLQAQGIDVAIVSNKDEAELTAQKEMLLHEPEFKDLVLVGKTNGCESKPSPAPIYEAMAQLDIPTNHAPSILFVGDQVRSDVAAAKEAGCKACVIGEDGQNTLIGFAKNILRDRDNGRSTIQDQDGEQIEVFRDLSSLAQFLGTIEPQQRMG